MPRGIWYGSRILMKMHRTTILLFLFALLVPLISTSQSTNAGLIQRYPFLNISQNRIQQPSHLDSFFQQLALTGITEGSVVSIVHIGDSHIQPDLMGQVLRQSFQQRYGNAGRGLVFPYQLAASNSPDDVRTSSPQRWQFNRLAHPEINIPYGISGYGIVNNNSTAEFRLQLRGSGSTANHFSRMLLFSDSSSTWTAKPTGSDSTFVLNRSAEYNFLHELILPDTVNDITFSAIDSFQKPSLYGIELSNNRPGVTFHSIGVNGARVDHFNRAEKFWEQLPILKAKLYIVSLGTNEAQARVFNEANFLKELQKMLTRLRDISPDASFLFTTPPISFRGKMINPNLERIRKTIVSFCKANNIACWDLRSVLSTRSGFLRIMYRDRIHYTAEGYRLMGRLLRESMIDGR